VPELNYNSRSAQQQSGTGLYLQDQMRWGPVAVHLGGRFDWYDSLTKTRSLTTGANTRTSSDANDFTGRAAIIYNSGIGLAPYYSYTESFEPQAGTTAPQRGTAPFEPTTGRQHEVGLRYQPPGVNAMFTAALFDLVRQNVLTTDPLYPAFSVQTGEVRTRGLELEARGSLAEGLSFVASYTYLDSENTSSNSTALVDRLLGTRTSTVPLQGREPISVPRHQASAYGQYSFQPRSALEGVTAGLGVRYVGSSWGDAANTLRVPDATLVDLMARYDLGRLAPALNGASVQLNLSNLFDEKYVSSCLSYGFCYYGYRRTALVTLRHQF